MNIHTANRYKKIILGVKLTLIGEDGLDNISKLLEKVKEENIVGSFVEAGIWRGGACIWARIYMDYLKLYSPVIGCDSFEGLPKPSYSQDEGDQHYLIKELAVSLNTVHENFNYFVLEGECKLVKGLFKDTLPLLKNEIDSICILRVDSDMYESTMQVLENLYDKVSTKGFVIVDDYILPGAKMAIDEFRQKKNIESPLIKVNDTIHYWKK